jgi:hypothetical protein
MGNTSPKNPGKCQLLAVALLEARQLFIHTHTSCSLSFADLKTHEVMRKKNCVQRGHERAFKSGLFLVPTARVVRRWFMHAEGILLRYRGDHKNYFGPHKNEAPQKLLRAAPARMGDSPRPAASLKCGSTAAQPKLSGFNIRNWRLSRASGPNCGLRGGEG